MPRTHSNHEVRCWLALPYDEIGRQGCAARAATEVVLSGEPKKYRDGMLAESDRATPCLQIRSDGTGNVDREQRNAAAGEA